ncbi:hypothetical protein FKM82_013725 [Ascaphus truei]
MKMHGYSIRAIYSGEGCRGRAVSLHVNISACLFSDFKGSPNFNLPQFTTRMIYLFVIKSKAKYRQKYAVRAGTWRPLCPSVNVLSFVLIS